MKIDQKSITDSGVFAASALAGGMAGRVDILNDIRDKKQLYNLYASQYSQRKIRQAINNIIQHYRPSHNNKNHRISNQEALTFIYLYGLPKGYTLHPHQAITLQELQSTQKFQTFINTQQLCEKTPSSSTKPLSPNSTATTCATSPSPSSGANTSTPNTSSHAKPSTKSSKQ